MDEVKNAKDLQFIISEMVKNNLSMKKEIDDFERKIKDEIYNINSIKKEYKKIEYIEGYNEKKRKYENILNENIENVKEIELSSKKPSSVAVDFIITKNDAVEKYREELSSFLQLCNSYEMKVLENNISVIQNQELLAQTKLDSTQVKLEEAQIKLENSESRLLSHVLTLLGIFTTIITIILTTISITTNWLNNSNNTSFIVAILMPTSIILLSVFFLLVLINQFFFNNENISNYKNAAFKKKSVSS